MYENQQNFGELEGDPFELNEVGGYGFMNAEYEGEGFGGDFEDFAGDGFDQLSDQYGDGFDQYGAADNYWEGELEGEGFDPFGDQEGEEFFGKIWSAAKNAAKIVAPIAKKFAPQIGSVIGGALGGPAGAMLGSKLGGFVKQMEGEEEGETEDELNAPVRVSRDDDQLSESMAVAATRANPNDAGMFGSAITVTIASRAPLSVRAVVPVLAKAGSDVARRLSATGDPRAKALIRMLPTIQKKTVATLTQKAQTGRPVTPKTAVRVMARHASRTLANPQSIAKALAQNAAKKRGIDRRAVAGAERFF